MNSSHKKEKIATGFIAITLLIMAAFSIINDNIFSLYSEYAIYIYLIASMIGFCIVKSYSKKLLLFLIITALYIFISILINMGGIGSAITFLIPLLLFIYISKMPDIRRYKKIIIPICAAIIIYTLYYSIRYSNNYRYYSVNDINPNTIGIYSMFAFMLMSTMMGVDSKKKKVLFILFVTITLLTQYNCESRGTTLATVVYLLMTIIPNKFITKKSTVILTIAIIIIGTIIPFAYLNMYNNGVNYKIFGKSLYTGREQIWKNMSDSLNENTKSLLIGLGSKTELWKNHSLNVHNNYLNIIVNFGIIGYFLYFVFIIRIISFTSNYMDNNTIKKMVFMFLTSVLILGYTETTSLWAPIFIFSYISLGSAYKIATTSAEDNQRRLQV